MQTSTHWYLLHCDCLLLIVSLSAEGNIIGMSVRVQQKTASVMLSEAGPSQDVVAQVVGMLYDVGLFKGQQRLG